MGLDGQTMPNRRDCTKVATKEEDKSSASARRAAHGQEVWTTCAVSGKALWEPLVVCGMGRLYRKEEVLVELIQRKGQERRPVAPHVAHITSMRDVLPVTLTVNPSSAYIVAMGEEVAYSRVKNILSLWVCPITGPSTTGTHSFLFCVPCGHVVSHEAVKALGSSCLPMGEGKDSMCPVCGAAAQALEVAPTEERGTAQLQRFKEHMRGFYKKRKSDGDV